MANNGHKTWENQPNQSQCQVKKIDVLPDDVLLEVFGFYTKMCGEGVKWEVEGWQSLVHVCRRWRSLVFQSPCRLELQLYCTPETPAKDTLDVWPALPLIIAGHLHSSSDTDNIITALGQHSRVCRLSLWDLSCCKLDSVLAAMQVPFPELTDLRLFSSTGTMPVIPDLFLGRSAPRLRDFEMSGIPFPGLPKLHLSATHLVTLCLSDIPHFGHISPEVMVSSVSVFSSLESLTLEFRSPQSIPSWESRSLPPQKRSILPALKRLYFQGITEYLEELVTRIDTPQLNLMHLTFFSRIDYDCPRLAQFINRTPELTRALDKALVHFNDRTSGIALQHESSINDLCMSTSCREPVLQRSFIEQICNSSLHPLSTIEALYIKQYSQHVWTKDAIENTLWLQLLLPFTAVKNLYLFEEFAPGIVASLQEHAGGGITEVLPSLQNIFVQGLRPSGSFQDSIGQFVDARQLSGRPITISFWDLDFDTE